MKQQYLINGIILFVMFFFISCKKDKTSQTNPIVEPIAIVNNDKIYLSDIDKEINFKLYDILFQVYLIRVNALEEKINQKIIEKEACNLNISSDDFLDSIVYKNINNENLKKFSRDCKYDKTGIPVVNNSLDYYDINSTRGRMLLKDKYKEFLLENYIGKSKNKYKIKSNLVPPNPPLVDLSSLNAMYKGNLNSKITVWVLSDVENINCKTIYPKIDSLYNKYNTKIRFAYINFSGDVTNSAIALECAKKQNCFWEMYDQLSELKNRPSNKQILFVVDKMKLNKERFIKDFKDSTITHSIIDEIKQLQNKGFWGVPSIIVDKKIVLDVYSKKAIENAIRIELSKKN